MSHVRNISSRVRQILFGAPTDDRLYRTVATSLLLIAFLAGIVHWLWFFNWAEFSLEAYDWPKEHQYYSVLQDALSARVIPYHVSMLAHGTHRFLAVPETLASPQIVFLQFMGIREFIVFNVILLYALGFWACLIVRKRYRLSLFTFALFWSLFNFNGHITSHLSVGHSMWTGYFLLPWFVLFVLEMVQRPKSYAAPIKLSLVLFAMLLQGSFHIFNWCLIFLVVLGVFNWAYVKRVSIAIVTTFVLSAFRLIPSLITFWDQDSRFVSGYPTVYDLFDALTIIKTRAAEAIGVLGALNWWEYDVYIGMVGLAVIAYFGVYLRFSRNWRFMDLRYPALDFPILATVLFSMHCWYGRLGQLRLPFVEAERVASRFLILAIIVLLHISCIRLQRFLDGRKITNKAALVAVGGLLYLAFGLAKHSRVWRPVLSDMPVFHPDVSIISQHDPCYAAVFAISAFISAQAVVLVSWFLMRGTNRSG